MSHIRRMGNREVDYLSKWDLLIISVNLNLKISGMYI